MKETSIYHGLLIYYLKEKSKILKDKTGISLITKADIKEINEWSIYKVVVFLTHLQCPHFVSDSDLCPWCEFYNNSNECEGCEYGRRHRRCIIGYGVNPKSTYGKIIKKGGQICYNKTVRSLTLKVIDYYENISSGKEI